MKKALLMVFVVGLLGGCAFGPVYKTVKADTPPPEQGLARVMFYRVQNPLALLFPRVVVVDGKRAGDLFAGTMFYKDLPAGRHVIKVADEDAELALDLVAGETVYVNLALDSADGAAKARLTRETEAQAIEWVDNAMMIEAVVRDWSAKPPVK